MCYLKIMFDVLLMLKLAFWIKNPSLLWAWYVYSCITPFIYIKFNRTTKKTVTANWSLYELSLCISFELFSVYLITKKQKVKWYYFNYSKICIAYNHLPQFFQMNSKNILIVLQPLLSCTHRFLSIFQSETTYLLNNNSTSS